MYGSWALAGIGVGLGTSSIAVLLRRRFTTDADRGADSAALQLSDTVVSAITTGIAGVLVARVGTSAVILRPAWTWEPVA